MHIISEHMGTQEVMGRRLGPKYGRLGRYQHVWDAWSPAAAADGRREAIPVPMADRGASAHRSGARGRHFSCILYYPSTN